MAATFKLEVVETRRNKWTKYVWILYVLWLLLGSYNCYNNGFEKSWSQVLTPLGFLIFYLIDYFYSDKYMKSFLSVDEDNVSWKLKQMPSTVKIEWADIEWIKFEKDGVSFYEKNSFNYFLSTESFTQAQKEKLNKAITEIASEKNIRLEY